jgi:succinoglycan biosynthesis transport protein ExoP
MNSESSESTAREPLAVLRSGLPVVIVLTLFAAAIALALSLRQESLYRSTATVFVSTNSINTVTGSIGLLSSDPQRVLSTQAEVASLPEVARIAAKSSPIEVTPERLSAATEITPADDADSLTFTATDSDPDRARRFADAYAVGYVRYQDIQEREAQEELQRRIDELRAEGGPETGAAISDLLNRAGTGADQTGGSNTLGQPATAGEKIQPEPTKDTVLGGVIGLVLGISLVFARDALNTRVRTGEEVEERLGLPLLGRIPPPDRRGQRELDVLARPHTSQAEAYRLLATNMELVNLDRGAKSIMVTSPLHSEGKSLTTASLGVCFARRGYHVVVLEADVRRPVLADLFDLDERAGLSDVVLGAGKLEDALASIELPVEEHPPDDERGARFTNGAGPGAGRLEVLVAGPAPPSPPEFLKTQAVAGVLSQLTERADLVLIDTPPILGLSDVPTLIGSAPIDCVAVAVRVGTTGRRTVTELRRVLESAPVVKLGFFATGTRGEAESRYAYGYGYRQEQRSRARRVLSRSKDR